ncbi:complex 1 protein, LYR family protein (macronuclear) [Tetrahymena thermophila SB210]|uniref:Complex 1 protein, LYR family protein n=1 Tax=Tetrahymena thermophila (strain SB210) TaxID=312017 RepID=W7XKG2_TETTS|nr:complex 1 protein, LYR family protein [Tetrahymena thermophila SB210]EWS76501.1 complex 1 protein, LYR family protein [Tetrahymena thermophila SB210]|eukprot:XP_012650964.1 complex 1 protein, LYR family protein [Tetrahymena thermophila SB210]
MSTHKIQVLQLFKETLRAGFGFKDYNFRNYIVRRAKEDFRKYSALTDQNEIAKQIQFAKEQLELLQRQKIIQNLYYQQKSIIEK